MTKYKSVNEFLDDLPSDKKEQVQELRKYIHMAEPSLEESIKWNAPSYAFNGEDRITFNLRNKEGLVKLVFHMGARRKENRKAEPILRDTQIIEWVSDIRGYATFADLKQIITQEQDIKDAVSRWLAI